MQPHSPIGDHDHTLGESTLPRDCLMLGGGLTGRRPASLQVEFAAAYHRLCGANVLFPFGFHCTGMPIKVWLSASDSDAPPSVQDSFCKSINIA